MIGYRRNPFNPYPPVGVERTTTTESETGYEVTTKPDWVTRNWVAPGDNCEAIFFVFVLELLSLVVAGGWWVTGTKRPDRGP